MSSNQEKTNPSNKELSLYLVNQGVGCFTYISCLVDELLFANCYMESFKQDPNLGSWIEQKDLDPHEQVRSVFVEIRYTHSIIEYIFNRFNKMTFTSFLSKREGEGLPTNLSGFLGPKDLFGKSYPFSFTEISFFVLPTSSVKQPNCFKLAAEATGIRYEIVCMNVTGS